jgi:flagellar hook-basal body complex protein FliE
MNITSANQIGQLGIGKEMERIDFASEDPKANGSFLHEINSSMKDVNTLLAQSDKANQEIAIGKSENLHEAMISTEKADTALKYLVQVRNKILDAYREVMRMQI